MKYVPEKFVQNFYAHCWFYVFMAESKVFFLKKQFAEVVPESGIQIEPNWNNSLAGSISNWTFNGIEIGWKWWSNTGT